VVGGPDYRLRLVSGDNGHIEKSLSDWYDQMMENLSLQPINHPSWNHQEDLNQQESLYLYGQVLMAFAKPDDPVFQSTGLVFPEEGNAPLGLKPISPGQLFFTSQRLLFVLKGDVDISLPWDDLRSVDTVMDKIFNVGYTERQFGFVFAGQSVLKWLAYTRHWIHQNHIGEGQRIYQGFI
jgi:hypothetical protein